MIISIAGQPGSGKSTVAVQLSEKLDMDRHYMGAIIRLIAEKRGVSIDEMQTLAAKDPEIDKDVDHYIIELGGRDDNFIIESRVAWHLLPNSFKVYLSVEPHVGARRVAEKENSPYGSQDEALKKLAKRTQAEQARFKAKYSIDVDNQENFDLIIDTTDTSPEQVADMIALGIPQAKSA
jgi:CMP/dCMP kinase